MEKIEQVAQSQPPSQSARFQDNISVSSYGFLTFPSLQDFNEYREYLTSKTHGEVQSFLNSISFNSRGETMYGQQYWNERVTEEQATNYIFNEDKIFQINNVVMKPINETIAEVKWQFILTMVSTNLSATSYQNLASGTYDGSTMNKFATNPVNGTFDLFTFIRTTPSGYEETVANSAQAKRPMFGSQSSTTTTCGQSYYDAGSNNCVQGCQNSVITTTYIFWIGFPSEPEVISSYTVPATGC